MKGGAAPSVVLQHVSKSFGERPILRDLSLQVRAGEALCILGRSGTGKSVTLKLIISLLKPEQGQIWIEGEDITGLHARGCSGATGRQPGHAYAFGAALAGGICHYSAAARLTMWSLTLPQVGTTLTATLVGFHTVNRAGQPLLDGRLLDAVFALVLLTAILGPALTEHFAPRMLAAPADRDARNARDASPLAEEARRTRDPLSS